MAQITMDVFKQDAFSAQNLTGGIDKEGYVPTMLGTIPDLFVPPPLGQPRSKMIFVETRENQAALIQTSPRGSPPTDGRKDEASRKAYPFETQRLARKRRINASEIAGIRSFGQITEMQTVEMMVQRYQYLMQRDFALTWEHMRLACVQGKLVDADGSEIYDWADEFGQDIPDEVTWTMSASTGDGSTRSACATAARSIVRNLKGLGGNAIAIYALCGDAFWDKLIASKEVRETYQFAMQAQQLREATAWQQFFYGGVTFIDYRGTDDKSAVAVESDKAKFFPAGAGIFQAVFAPADERFEFVDTPGQEAYSWIVTDNERNMWSDVEMYSYPLFVCTMPQALYQATI